MRHLHKLQHTVNHEVFGLTTELIKEESITFLSNPTHKLFGTCIEQYMTVDNKDYLYYPLYIATEFKLPESMVDNFLVPDDEVSGYINSIEGKSVYEEWSAEEVVEHGFQIKAGEEIPMFTENDGTHELANATRLSEIEDINENVYYYTCKYIGHLTDVHGNVTPVYQVPLGMYIYRYGFQDLVFPYRQQQ